MIGMPGSGKTSFGKTYAFFSGRYFLDFDKYFEMVTKKKIRDVLKKDGEETFLALEEKILKKLEKKHNYVIAMGSGTICHAENFEFTRRLGLIVFLETPLDILAKRILSDQVHKLQARLSFSHLNTLEEIQEQVNELWESRKEFYEKSYLHLNTAYSSLDNLKLQLGLYEKKSLEREQYNKGKVHNKFPKNRPFAPANNST
jgi:shikimate kinase